MKMQELKADKRTTVGRKVRQEREQSKIPAVLYGHGITNENLSVDVLAFERVYAEAGESTIIALDTGAGKPVNVLIHNLQKDPLSDQVMHIDFFQVRMDEKIDTEVAFEFVGEAPAVKEFGGVLVRNMESLQISCLPADLPGHVTIDLSTLATYDDRIIVADLSLDDKITLHIPDTTVIALVSPPRTEEEVASLDADVDADVSQVEGVEKEGDDTGEDVTDVTADKKDEKKEEKPAE